MNLLKAFFIFFAMTPFTAMAVESLTIKESVQRSHLSVTAEMGVFKLGKETLETQGAQIQYAYSLFDSVRIETFVATAFSGGDDVSSSFFGFGAYGMYGVMGECCRARRSIDLNARTLVMEESAETLSLLIGAGVDQLFLNGSAGVYSSSGLGVAGSMIYPFKTWSLRVNAKQSFLSAGGESITATFVGAGAAFSF